MLYWIINFFKIGEPLTKFRTPYDIYGSEMINVFLLLFFFCCFFVIVEYNMVALFYIIELQQKTGQWQHLGSLQDSGNQLRVGSLQDVCGITAGCVC